MKITNLETLNKTVSELKEIAKFKFYYYINKIKQDLADLSSENKSLLNLIKVTNKELLKKQNKLIAGENITIKNNVISSKGGGGEVYGFTINPGFAECPGVGCTIRKLTKEESGALLSWGYDYYNYVSLYDKIPDGDTGWIIVDGIGYNIIRSAFVSDFGPDWDVFYVEKDIEGVDEYDEYFAIYAANTNNATGEYSHAEGYNTYTESDYSHAEGEYTSASGRAAHAECYHTTASGNYSHAEGDKSHAENYCAHAEGYNSQATSSNYSSNTLAADNSTTNGHICHAEGNACIAQGYNSHAEGKKTFAKGGISHAEGNSTTASGESSHAEGYQTTASSEGSHAEGTDTTASGAVSHAEGLNTESSGTCSHAEGAGTTASGEFSHAEGNGAAASGVESHAEGNNTIAQNESEHAEGSYNSSHKASDSYGDAGNTQHSVGIGADENNRKNAFEIMQNGDVYVYGVGGYDGTNPNSSLTLQAIINSLLPNT